MYSAMVRQRCWDLFLHGVRNNHLPCCSGDLSQGVNLKIKHFTCVKHVRQLWIIFRSQSFKAGLASIHEQCFFPKLVVLFSIGVSTLFSWGAHRGSFGTAGPFHCLHRAPGGNGKSQGWNGRGDHGKYAPKGAGYKYTTLRCDASTVVPLSPPGQQDP